MSHPASESPQPAALRGQAARMALAGAGILVVSAVTLRLLGRRWWCAGGGLSPWSWDIWSRHNSQHLIDPYTFSHVQHGLLFYALAWLALRRLPAWGRFAVALGFEALWEIAENTNAMIQRYREVTISLDYFGDSVLNSLGDIVACALGYGLAALLPTWGSVTLYAAIEAAMILALRDSLLLNVWMLLAPSERLRAWQMGAAPPGLR